MCSLWNNVYLNLSKCVNCLLGPWKEVFTSIANKEDLFSVIVMGSLLTGQYFVLTCTLWSLNLTLLNAQTELLITFGYMYFFCWVAESYFGRMFVHAASLIVSLTGCFVSFLNEMWEPYGRLKFEPFLLRALLSSMPLQAAAVLTEKTFLKKVISLDHFLFLVMWTGLIGSSAISIIVEDFKEASNLRLSLSMCVSGIACYQLLIVLMKYKLFQDTSFYYNIHFAVSRVMVRFMVTKLTGFENTDVREHCIVKIAAVKIIRMMPFVLSLFMFAISIEGVLFLLAFQSLHIYQTAWMPAFKFPTLSTIVSAALLPIMYLYVFPTLYRFKLLKTDLQKIGLCFMLLGLCLLCSCGIQYLLSVRVTPFPPSNHSQLNIVNGFDSDLMVVTTQENFTVLPHHLYTVTNDFDNQTVRWFMEVYNFKNTFHKQFDLTAMSKLAVLCVASKLGLNCRGIFSTSPPFMHMIPPQSSTICLINTLPTDVVMVFTDPVNNQNFSLLASPNQISDRIVVAKHYDIAVFSNEEKIVSMKNLNVAECSAIAVYIFSENQHINFRLHVLANTKVLPDFFLLPSLFFFGTSDAIAIFYMFRFCYEQSPETLLATIGTFAYTLEIGPKMVYSLIGDIEIDSTTIFFVFLAHISFSVIHILITIKTELYKELDKALRSSFVLGKYVPSSISLIKVDLVKIEETTAHAGEKTKPTEETLKTEKSDKEETSDKELTNE